MRKLLALIATGGVLAVALTGCAAAAEPEATEGPSSAAVTVTGDFGETPQVEFPTPLAVDDTQCTVITEGRGEHILPGQAVQYGMYVANGTTGQTLLSAGFGADAPQLNVGSLAFDALREGLGCAREGGRVAVVAPARDVFGEGQGNDSLGVAPDDSLVFVIDVRKAFLERADGVVQLSRDGFPAVVLDGDGRPGITVPNADAPERLEVETLKRGHGTVVADGDTVLVKTTAVDWENGDVIDSLSTWTTTAAAPKVVTMGQGGDMPAGFEQAVLGSTVGSQLVAILPPDVAYGDEGSGPVPAGTTIVFVIDVLGVIPAAG